MFVQDALASRVNIRNNMIVDNGAADMGGGVTLDDSQNVAIVNNTIAENATTGSSENSRPIDQGGTPTGAGLASEANDPRVTGAPAAFSRPVALFNNVFRNNRAFLLDHAGPGAALVAQGVIDFEVHGTGSAADVFTPRYSILTNGNILRGNGSTGTVPGGQGNQIGADPAFASPFTLTLAVAGSRGDPQQASVTISGQDPADGVPGDYHITGGSPAIDNGVKCALIAVPGPGERRHGQLQPHAADRWSRRPGADRHEQRLRRAVQAAATDAETPHAVGHRGGRAGRGPGDRAMSVDQEKTMDRAEHGSTRRQFFKAAGVGAATVAVSGGVLAATRGAPAAHAAAVSARDHVVLTGGNILLAATDGYMTLPGREDDPVYIFGFIPVPNDTVSSLENTYKGRTQHIAPILDTTDGTDVYLKLTNLGLIQRPDLTDSHTLHWHGFRTPTSLFDGVPEVSIAVPINRQFTYFYRPHNPGTYMYHCHFEDVEHVQMGMTSIVFVRPSGHPNGGPTTTRRPRSTVTSRSSSTRSGRDVPRRRSRHPGEHPDRLRPAVVHAQRALLPGHGAAQRRPGAAG